MSCYHPLTAIWTGLRTANNKKDYVILSGAVENFSLDDFQKQFKGRDYDSKALTPFRTFKYSMPVPCGRCIGCRLDYARSWAVRCILEAKDYENNWFLTLTYDDAHLPENNSLSKRDLQLFLKRLRKYFSDNYDHVGIRFFAAGEYGDKYKRPHYHLILFNLPLNDAKFFSCSRGNKYYVSDTISKLWTFGFHTLGEVTFETAGYTARYVMKKQKGIYSGIYSQLNIEPEFTTMSRKPGIGTAYFDSNFESIYSTDEIWYLTSSGQANKVTPSAYFDKKFDKLDPIRLESIKESRAHRAVIHRDLVIRTNDFADDRSYLEHEELLKQEKLKLLHRKIF